MANLQIALALARLDRLDLEFDLELVRYALAVEEEENNRRIARRRKWWMKPWLRRRTFFGALISIDGRTQGRRSTFVYQLHADAP